MAREWVRIASHGRADSSDVLVFRAPKLSIDADPRQHVAVDAEMIMRTPIRVSVVREALLVMVPRAFEDLDEA